MLWCRDEASVGPLLSSWWTPANWTVHCLPRGAFSLVETVLIAALLWLLKWRNLYLRGEIIPSVLVFPYAQCLSVTFSLRRREDWTLHFIDPYWVAAYNSRVPLRIIAQLLNAGDLAVFRHCDWYFVCAHQYVDWSGADLVLSQPNQMHSRCQAHRYIY